MAGRPDTILGISGTIGYTCRESFGGRSNRVESFNKNKDMRQMCAHGSACPMSEGATFRERIAPAPSLEKSSGNISERCASSITVQ